MAWIEVHQELRDHPKIIRLALSLSCSKAEAIGNIVSLWLWCVAYARDGQLTQFSDSEISVACNYAGKDPKKFVESLVQSGFLDSKDDKKILHDWKKHGLRILEQSRKRMAKSRKANELGGQTVAQPLRNGDAYQPYLSLFLSNHSNLPNLPVLQTEEFGKALKEWIEYRTEKKKPILPSQLEKQLIWLVGQKNPVACIEQSIRNGWQGLFEEKSNGTQTNQHIDKHYHFDPSKYPTLQKQSKS